MNISLSRFCGGFTTFSSSAVETVATAESGEIFLGTRFALVKLIGAVGTLNLGSLLVSATF
jgi:fluoride ion exporter CrcB/FEX